MLLPPLPAMTAQVRDAMSHIWHALLDDPKVEVTRNFDGERASARGSERSRGGRFPFLCVGVRE